MPKRKPTRRELAQQREAAEQMDAAEARAAYACADAWARSPAGTPYAQSIVLNTLSAAAEKTLTPNP